MPTSFLPAPESLLFGRNANQCKKEFDWCPSVIPCPCVSLSFFFLFFFVYLSNKYFCFGVLWSSLQFRQPLWIRWGKWLDDESQKRTSIRASCWYAWPPLEMSRSPGFLAWPTNAQPLAGESNCANFRMKKSPSALGIWDSELFCVSLGADRVSSFSRGIIFYNQRSVDI